MARLAEQQQPLSPVTGDASDQACGIKETPLRWLDCRRRLPSSPAIGCISCSSISCQGRTMRKNTLAGLVVAAVLSLSLTACKDTKTLQENEQLKAQVAEL